MINLTDTYLDIHDIDEHSDNLNSAEREQQHKSFADTVRASKTHTFKSNLDDITSTTSPRASEEFRFDKARPSLRVTIGSELTSPQ